MNLLFHSALFCIFLYFTAASHHLQVVPTIEISGNKFFKSSDKSQFFIRGVAYQRPYDPEVSPLGYVDSLALPSLCLKDLELFKELGINTVRVYQVDPKANHDVCMNAFGANGIYVFLDLAEPKISINRNKPTWDIDIWKRYTAVVDSMHKYPNVIGFIAGNEVIDSVDNTNSAVFVKASIRDMKDHINRKGYRRIPLGYASTDESITRLDSFNYFVCTDHDTKNATVDFYAINMFEWCGYSSFNTCGYRERTAEFSLLPVPVFFSEYGCNTIIPRPFTEIGLIYGPIMTQVWSGGIIYELFQKENNFGLVEESSNGKITKLDDFNTVRLRFLENKPKGIQRTLEPSESNFQVECPSVSTTWKSLPILPPTPDEGKCECLQTTLSCVITPYQDVHEHNFLTELCDLTDCSDILANPGLGIYGKFSGCSIRQKISYVLNKYWLEQRRKPELCNFSQRAVLISNTHLSDLDNLQASDGRTCRQALDGMFSPESFLAPKSKKSRDKVSRNSIPSLQVHAQSSNGRSVLSMIELLQVGVVVCSLMYLTM